MGYDTYKPHLSKEEHAMLNKINALLGNEAEQLLNHTAKFPKEKLHLPGPDYIDRILYHSDRNINVLKNLQLRINP
jgi:class I fructose-bisphosphate aldolase